MKRLKELSSSESDVCSTHLILRNAARLDMMTDVFNRMVS